MGVFFWILATATLCLQWIFLSLSSTALSPELQALSAGLAIFGASFMLSWAAELAQLEIPQALALALLALIAVLLWFNFKCTVTVLTPARLVDST